MDQWDDDAVRRVREMSDQIEKAMKLARPQLSALEQAMKDINEGPVARAMRDLYEGPVAQAIRDFDRFRF